ncbi:hypothetical protein PG996_000685 [Apiospora saccharicola]|uniref:Uncharacterized protein n=1 Tax=Apiospora saccharicola TaxID=335842 RepID=A0ABR1WIC3_9PEZI
MATTASGGGPQAWKAEDVRNDTTWILRLTPEEVEGFRTAMGLYMGVARPQNRASEVINDVRDAGGSYKSPGGRGYNTNAGLAGPAGALGRVLGRCAAGCGARWGAG